jgi:ATP-dependent RNA helicase DeaD
VAISLVDVLERLRLTGVIKQYGIDMEQRPTPTDGDVQAIVAERVTAALEARLRDLDGLVRERMQRMLPLARTFGESEDELAITAMLLDEFYQSTLHKPPSTPAAESLDQELESEAPVAHGRSGRSGRRGSRRRRPRRR